MLERLGAGGMGTVYLAQQDTPVRRRVAIKVTHRFQSDRQRQRFALEAQALATMRHPNVASLYDVGTMDDGTPFVVMELVDSMGELTGLPAVAIHRFIAIPVQMTYFVSSDKAVRDRTAAVLQSLCSLSHGAD